MSGTPSGHLTVVVAPGAVPDPVAARDVLDRALAARGLTGELLLARRAADVAALAPATPEPVLLLGPSVEVDDLRLPGTGTVLRVDLGDRPRDASPRVRRHLRGRGLDGLRSAVDAWDVHRTSPPATHRYGPGRDQHADLRLPTGVPGPGGHPVAVLVHGGYWRSRWESDLMEPMAVDLTARGWATWNVEYRRPDDHTWADTTADVATALAALADVDAPLDLDRVVLLGHSAGGQLVVRLAADVAAAVGVGVRPPAGTGAAAAAVRGAAPVRPVLTVALAGVLDLVDGDRRGLGGGAVARALGGAAGDVPDVYRASSPLERLPVGLPLAVVCGDEDELAGQSRAFAHAARAAGDDVVVVTGGGDHFAVIDPRSALWPRVVRVLTERGRR